MVYGAAGTVRFPAHLEKAGKVALKFKRQGKYELVESAKKASLYQLSASLGE